jgi:hypothetical protein
MSPRWKAVLWITGGAILTMLGILLLASIVIARRARDRVEEWLTRQYNGNAELAEFRVTIPFPRVQFEGAGLVVRFRGRQDLPPLVAVKRFTLRTPIWGLLRRSSDIAYLGLDGLQLNIPPREASGRASEMKAVTGRFRATRFDEIVAENAVLRILTQKPGKDPLEFDIQDLRLHSTRADGALEFRAALSNPKPPGKITSVGVFGPWNSETPSLTAVSGTYEFADADLGVFPGIAGILESRGTYQGVLEQIRVDGTTEIPDFRLTRSGHLLQLSTTFHATVDGTDGDTSLHPVEAHFGQTTFVAEGSVENVKGQKGKTITLDVNSNRARIEDLLLLATKQPPGLAGPMRFKAELILVPGPKEIPDRMKLNGSFDLGSVHFRSSALQQKFDNLSKRSQGKPQEVVNPEDATAGDDISSSMKGNFRLDRGILSLAALDFEVPGAKVGLDGTYSLDDETLDLHGELSTQAKLSETTTGFKSFLLKFADPVFAKQGSGAVLPIKITGPVEHLHYGLDLRHKSVGSTENH